MPSRHDRRNPAVLSALMGLAVVAVHRMGVATGVVEFALLVLVGAVVYGVLVLVLERFSGYDSVALCRRLARTVVS